MTAGYGCGAKSRLLSRVRMHANHVLCNDVKYPSGRTRTDFERKQAFEFGDRVRYTSGIHNLNLLDACCGQFDGFRGRCGDRPRRRLQKDMLAEATSALSLAAAAA